MKFSLITATLGREKELENLIISLKNQIYKNFELIIVDQNSTDMVFRLYKKYEKFITIKYFKINQKGLSLARNYGLQYVSGNIIAFPDDDCEYDKNTLNYVNNLFSNEMNKFDILTMRSCDKITNKDSNGEWPRKDLLINARNVFKIAISYTIFIKYKKLTDIYFDNKLGVGGIFGSGEETDMMLNLIHKRYYGRYLSNKYIYHPIKNEDISRIYNYALGFGAVLKKEICLRKNYSYIFKFILSAEIKPIIGILMGIIMMKKSIISNFIKKLKGRNIGFINYKI